MELDDNTNDYDVICDVKKSQNQQKKNNNNSAKFYKIVCTVYYHE